MTFWLDAQLDPQLAAWLGSRFGVVAKHLMETGLLQASDNELFDAARRFGEIVIVTKDADFIDLAKRLGPPPQVLHLECGNLSTISMQIWLASSFAEALARLQSGEAIVAIAGPRKS
jgi:predicted nuclease of predicted toxin-antitoxin system